MDNQFSYPEEVVNMNSRISTENFDKNSTVLGKRECHLMQKDVVP